MSTTTTTERPTEADNLRSTSTLSATELVESAEREARGVRSALATELTERRASLERELASSSPPSSEYDKWVDEFEDDVDDEDLDEEEPAGQSRTA